LKEFPGFFFSPVPQGTAKAGLTCRRLSKMKLCTRLEEFE